MDQLSSNNVVLVEDDELVATSISSLMRSRGVSITIFKSAEEFIQNSTSQPQGTLIVDVDLGHNKLSGIELIRWIRGKNWNNPIVILSGKVTIPQAVEAMRESVVDIISKPPELPRLIAAVQASFAKDSRNEPTTPALLAILESLSKTERAILELLLSGASNKVVASRLDLGLRSAVRYRKTLLEAFGFKTIPELAVALGAAGIGPTQISLPTVFAPTIPAQQRNQIRERVALIAKVLRDAMAANIESLRKAVESTVGDLESLVNHPHLLTAQQLGFQPSILIVQSDPRCGGMLRDLMRAYGIFAECCTTLESAVQYLQDCRDNPPTFVLVTESPNLTSNSAKQIASFSSAGSKQKLIYVGNTDDDSLKDDFGFAVLPSSTYGLELVQFVMTELQNAARIRGSENHP
ncbi:MAG: response regulator [Pirellulales bacterium]